MFEYDAESAKAADELDKHDLAPVLREFHGANVYEVAERIKDSGGAKIANAVECLTIDELVLYLERRYRMRSTEEVVSFMWWTGE